MTKEKSITGGTVKYKASGYGMKIEKVMVIKETEHFVTVQYDNRTRREAKKSGYDCFFDTWQEAKDHHIAVAEDKLNAARRQLEYAQGQYGNAKGIKQNAE